MLQDIIYWIKNENQLANLYPFKFFFPQHYFMNSILFWMLTNIRNFFSVQSFSQRNEWIRLWLKQSFFSFLASSSSTFCQAIQINTIFLCEMFFFFLLFLSRYQLPRKTMFKYMNKRKKKKSYSWRSNSK